MPMKSNFNHLKGGETKDYKEIAPTIKPCSLAILHTSTPPAIVTKQNTENQFRKKVSNTAIGFN